MFTDNRALPWKPNAPPTDDVPFRAHSDEHRAHNVRKNRSTFYARLPPGNSATDEPALYDSFTIELYTILPSIRDESTISLDHKNTHIKWTPGLYVSQKLCVLHECGMANIYAYIHTYLFWRLIT